MERRRVAYGAPLSPCLSAAPAARNDRGSEEVVAHHDERNDDEEPQRDDEAEAQNDVG